MKTYAFENLDVWQCSRRLSLFIYKMTARFPDEERFGLISQMRRAAISICSNLAEGTSRYNSKDKARYTETAYGSLMELLCQAILSHDLEYIQDEKMNEMRTMVDEIAVKATRLREAQLRS